MKGQIDKRGAVGTVYLEYGCSGGLETKSHSSVLDSLRGCLHIRTRGNEGESRLKGRDQLERDPDDTIDYGSSSGSNYLLLSLFDVPEDTSDVVVTTALHILSVDTINLLADTEGRGTVGPKRSDYRTSAPRALQSIRREFA